MAMAIDFRSFFRNTLRDMTTEERGGFRKMMKRLRRELNDETRFDELVGRGVKELNLRTATYNEAGDFVNYIWDRRKKYDARRAGRPNTRKFLALLRDALNDSACFDQLSLIGPYSFLLPTISDANREPGILICNHIPNCTPNADWSIMETAGNVRLWYHS